MKQVQLSKGVWRFDETRPLGPAGGFGAVYLGADEAGADVAVKRLHLDVQHHSSRELEIAESLLGHDYPHVIPIYDVGFDPASSRYFIVMALATQSLQDLIDKSAPVAEPDALEILNAITAGLEEIKDLVHRDLKPGNVLLHNGVWKLADLGLARFVEEATSPNTMKGFLSAPYAAPEQWRLERATKATDIYALGCIMYDLLTGAPPFDGPTQEDYSHQHQTVPPPALSASPRLRSLAATCLAKNQQVRPSTQSVRTQLQRARLAAGAATPNPLADVAAALAEQRAQREAEAAQQVKVQEDRRAAAKEAVDNVRQILEGLFETILADIPNSKRGSSYRDKYEDRQLEIAHGQLLYGIPFPYTEDPRLPGGESWDVLAGATIKVGITWIGPDLVGRSANLWFGKLAADDGYRWWEVSYTFTPSWEKRLKEIAVRPGNYRPFALYPGGLLDPDRPSSYGCELATNPRPIDGEFQEDFYSRWMNWLAKAALYDVTGENFFLNVPPKEEIEARFR